MSYSDIAAGMQVECMEVIEAYSDLRSTDSYGVRYAYGAQVQVLHPDRPSDTVLGARYLHVGCRWSSSHRLGGCGSASRSRRNGWSCLLDERSTRTCFFLHPSIDSEHMMIASISATAHIAAATNFAATATDGQLPFLDANGTPIPTRPEYVGGKYRDVPVGGTVEYIGGEYHVVPPGGNVEYIGGEYRVIPVDGNVEYIGGEYRTIPADGNVEYIGGEYRVVPAGMKYITSEESTGSFLPDVHRRWSP